MKTRTYKFILTLMLGTTILSFNSCTDLKENTYDTIVSENYLEKGDFVKMSNMSFGYTVPLKANKYVNGIRAYVSGDNLFCITGYSGLDPELSNSDAKIAGVDKRDKYPVIRSFTFGLNVTF